MCDTDSEITNDVDSDVEKKRRCYLTMTDMWHALLNIRYLFSWHLLSEVFIKCINQWGCTNRMSNFTFSIGSIKFSKLRLFINILTRSPWPNGNCRRAFSVSKWSAPLFSDEEACLRVLANIQVGWHPIRPVILMSTVGCPVARNSARKRPIESEFREKSVMYGPRSLNSWHS